MTSRRRLSMLALAGLSLMATALAVWIGSGWRALSHPDAYLQVAADTDLYPDLTGPVVSALGRHVTPSDPTNATIGDVQGTLSHADWNQIAAQIVPPDWLRTQTVRSVNLLFRWLDGDTAAMDEHYDLAAIVARLKDTAGDGLVSNILGRLPTCTAEQALALRAERTGAATLPPPLCLPTVLQRPTVRQALKQVMADFADHVKALQPSFHDAATAVLRSSGDDNPESSLVRLKTLRSGLQRLVSAAYLLIPALIALMVAVGIRSVRDFAYWTGRTVTIAALIAFLPSWLAPAASGQRLREAIAALLPSPVIDPIRARLAQDAQQALLSHFLRAAVIQALIVGGIGLTLILIAAWLDRRARKRQQNVQPAAI